MYASVLERARDDLLAALFGDFGLPTERARRSYRVSLIFMGAIFGLLASQVIRGAIE